MQGTGSRRVVVEELFVPVHRLMPWTGLARNMQEQPGAGLHSNPMYHGKKAPSVWGRYFRNLAVIRTHITLQLSHTSGNYARLHFGLPALGPF